MASPFAKLISMKIFKKPLILLALLAMTMLVSPIFAYDGDMDEYHEFKEDLALVKDGYVSAMNVAMDEKSVENASWADIEFEAPDLKYVKLSEVRGGFKLEGSHGAYKLNVEVKVTPGEDDMKYSLKFLKGCNAPGKEIAGEVFR